MSRALGWLSVVLASMGIGAARAGELDYTKVPLETVKSEVAEKKAILVDVREKKEWDRGHLKGAVPIPLSVLVEWDENGLGEEDRARLEKALPRGSVVYCHCAAGGRALSGGEVLSKLGYDARPLKTGYRDLVKAGFKPASEK